MKLYYYPGACSLAAHIALREAGTPPTLKKVDLRTKKVDDGSDFNAVNSKGYVPALALDSGEILSENVAILQYIADHAAGGKPSGLEHYRLVEWLSFINSEVHKNFSPLFNPQAGKEMQEAARANVSRRLGWLDRALGSRPFLTGEQFTVADAYLFTVLGWGGHVGIDIGQWPALEAFHKRVGARPHVQEALKAEGLIP